MITRSDVVVKRTSSELWRDVVIKKTGEGIGSLRRESSWTGRDVLWSIFDVEGNELTWSAAQGDAVKVLLNLYNKRQVGEK